MASDQNERVGRAADAALKLVTTGFGLDVKEAEVALLAAYRSWLLLCGLTNEEIVERATLGITLLAVPIGSIPA